MTNLGSILKSRHYFANKGPSSQSYGFSSSHVWMWELDCKEGWALRNWCFRIVVLEKTLESPLDCKEIKPVNPKRIQLWIYIEKTYAEAEAPILWASDVKSHLMENTLIPGKGMTEDEMVGWHHRLNGHESEQTPGDSERWGRLACCIPWDHRELDMMNDRTRTKKSKKCKQYEWFSEKKKVFPKMLVNGGLMWIQNLGMGYTPTRWREARCLTISEVMWKSLSHVWLFVTL